MQVSTFPDDDGPLPLFPDLNSRNNRQRFSPALRLCGRAVGHWLCDPHYHASLSALDILARDHPQTFLLLMGISG